MMDFEFCLTELDNNAKAVRQLVKGASAEQARWKPAADSWSVLEVINHLVYEEREDFRPRVKILLSGSDAIFEPIHPSQAVIDGRYNERDLESSLADFMEERQASLDWLRGLREPDWNVVYQHPQQGQYHIPSGDLFVAWVAHDVLHLRQLVELKWAYQQTQFGGFNRQYAGDW
jgi:DinB family protein